MERDYKQGDSDDDICNTAIIFEICLYILPGPYHFSGLPDQKYHFENFILLTFNCLVFRWLNQTQL